MAAIAFAGAWYGMVHMVATIAYSISVSALAGEAHRLVIPSASCIRSRIHPHTPPVSFCACFVFVLVCLFLCLAVPGLDRHPCLAVWFCCQSSEASTIRKMWHVVYARFSCNRMYPSLPGALERPVPSRQAVHGGLAEEQHDKLAPGLWSDVVGFVSVPVTLW